ncbi:MAG: hypothetical protein HONBIEJF_02520 [Fimbriimonadaceae bacterium]|nr:hypothetical protein [Fimbriimonadaceae bacterium]
MSLHAKLGLARSVPEHWIGTWKGWEDWCDSLSSALIELTPAHLATHAYAIGASGSGKTCFLQSLVAGDILRGHSIIVLDARGDFAGAALELAARAGVEPSLVKFFNLRERSEPLGFNPLGGVGEPYFKALGFLDSIEAESASWGVQIAEYLQNAALLLAETGKPITDLERLFHDRATRLALIAETQTDSLRSFWTRYDALSADRQASIASSVLNKVSTLVCTEGLRRMYGHPQPVDLGAQLRTPGSITLISLAVDELHQAGWRAGSLFLSSICREVFSQVGQRESQRNAVRLFVDEFEHFDGKHFELILAEGRRFRFSTVLAHQTLAQLSPTMRSIILDNVGIKLVLRTSHANAEILNRDLAGVRGAFDIAGLNVGEAILWVRGLGAHPVQLNAPVLNESGGMSEQAQQLLERSKACSQLDQCPEPDGTGTSNKSAAWIPLAANPRMEQKPGSTRPLEDWLE